MFTRALSKTGMDFNTFDTFKAAITAAGFTSIHEKTYKVPFEEWAKEPCVERGWKMPQNPIDGGYGGLHVVLLDEV